jgi:hypothetical protein
MPGPCETRRYALATTDLARLARQLGYAHLGRRLARHPGSVVGHRFARQLALAADKARHHPHQSGRCRRTGQLGGEAVVLLTVPDGSRHLVRSARRSGAFRNTAGEETEALFDTMVG